MSRFASEHTRHSSAVGSLAGVASSGIASAWLNTGAMVTALELGTPAPLVLGRELVSASGVSLTIIVPSLRHDVSVLQRFGSGQRSSGVWPGNHNTKHLYSVIDYRRFMNIYAIHNFFRSLWIFSFAAL